MGDVIRDSSAASPDGRKTVAAIVTTYHHWMHAENIVNRLLEGYSQHWVHVPPRVRVS